MNKPLDALKLPNNLKFKTINYKELNQLPSLQQLCNDVIQAKTNANIICFPYLQLEKRLNQASLEIDIKQVNNIDTKIKDAMKNKMLTFQQSI